MRIKALVATYIALLALIAIVVFAMQARDDEFVLTLVRCRECKDGGQEWEGVFRNNSKHEVFIDDLETGPYLLYIRIEGKWHRCPQGCDVIDPRAGKRISVGANQEVRVSFRVYMHDPHAQWFAVLAIYSSENGEEVSLCASGIARRAEGGWGVGSNHVFKEFAGQTPAEFQAQEGWLH